MPARWVGEEALDFQNPEIWSRDSPCEGGFINNFDDMALIWEHAFKDQLDAKTEDHPVLMVEPDRPYNNKYTRQKITEMMFEAYSSPALHLSTEPPLSLIASGRTTGLVLRCGHDNTYAMPVYEGFEIKPLWKSLDCSGSDLTDLLLRMLLRDEDSRDMLRNRHRNAELFRKVKEELCCVAKCYYDNPESATKVESVYRLPDGKPIVLDTQRFTVPEVFFQPAILGISAASIQYVVMNAIVRADRSLRSTLYHNIVLTGGSTKFPGFASRLHHELESATATGVTTTVIPHADPIAAPWIGGSMLANLSTFKHMCISASEYNEVGLSIFARKWF